MLFRSCDAVPLCRLKPSFFCPSSVAVRNNRDMMGHGFLELKQILAKIGKTHFLVFNKAFIKRNNKIRISFNCFSPAISHSRNLGKKRTFLHSSEKFKKADARALRRSE